MLSGTLSLLPAIMLLLWMGHVCSVQQKIINGPACSFLKQRIWFEMVEKDLNIRSCLRGRSWTDLNSWLSSVELQSCAAVLHPAKTHVLHLLLSPVLFLLSFFKTLRRRCFALHDGRSWQKEAVWWKYWATLCLNQRGILRAFKVFNEDPIFSTYKILCLFTLVNECRVLVTLLCLWVF